jgi:HEAT repeat protein
LIEGGKEPEMSLGRFLAKGKPDIRALTQARDIRGLIVSLDHRDFDVEWRAARALGTMGADATLPLINLLGYPGINTRLGAIEALGAIRDPRSIEVLAALLASHETSELRWAAALALGEIGDQTATPALLSAIRDDNRYVRYGAAKALEQIGWLAETDRDRAFYCIALQDWDAIKKLGKSATGPLIDLLKERHPAIRAQIIEILGSIGGVEAKKSCEQILRDPDGDVRWRAVLSSRQCGVPTSYLPLQISRRQRTGPSALGATVLNFFFLGIGYDYVGKWWGVMILETYMMLLTLAQLELGPFMPFLIFYPVTALFATQTYFMVKRESEMAG